MRSLKRILSVVAIISAVFAILLLGGCKGGCKKTNDESVVTEAKLNRTSLSLEVLESYNLVVENAKETVTWASADDGVAIIDENGKVTGVSEGETQVTAKCGDAEFTCDVTVMPSADVPALSVFVSEIGLLQGGSYTVESDIVYKGERYTDAKYFYAIDDEAVATVDGRGTIVGVKAGKTQLVISAEWKIFKNIASLTAMIPVEVKPNIGVEIRLNDDTIYTADVTVFGTKFSSSLNLVAETRIDGKITDRGEIEWKVENESVAKIENGNLKTVSVGTTKIYCVYSVDGSVVTSVKKTISVEKPFLDLSDEKPLLVDTYKDDTKTEITGDLAAAFDGEKAITSVIDANSGKAVDCYDLSTGKFIDDKVKVGEYVYDISNDFYTVRRSVFIATKVIYTAKELASLQTYGNIAKAEEHKFNDETFIEYRYSGYFALANDIVFSDADYGEGKTFLSTLNMYSGSVQVRTCGYYGVFEGCGYSVIGVKVGEGGIFGDISSEGVVRNLNVYGAKMSGGSQNGIIARNVNGTLDGVTLTADLNSCYESASIAYLANGATLKNVNVYVAGVRDNNEGSSFIIWTKGAVSAINCSVNKTNTPIIKNDEGGAKDKLIVKEYDLTAENESLVYSGSLNPQDITVAVDGAVKSVWTAGRTITEEVEITNGKVVLKAEFLPQILFGGENSVIITTDKTSYRVRVIVSEFAINSTADFEAFIDYVNAGSTLWQKTVNLGADIDFADYEYKNGKGYLRGAGNGFNGTLNGNGYVIKNLKVNWTLFTRTYNANINNLAFINLEFQNNWGRGIIDECAGNTTIENVYAKITSDGVYSQDYAIATTVSGNAIIKNCVINKSHGTASDNTLVGIINGNASLTLSNVYSIGGTPGVATTKDGVLTGGDNVIYKNNASGALTAITDAGLTKENGWNTDLWKIDDNGNLTFRGYTVIQK